MKSQKIKFNHTVNYNEVDQNLTLRLDSLFGYLQFAAVNHSEMVGAGTEFLKQLGYTWVLGKIQIILDHMPRLGDPLEIFTWSLGAKGFVATRDFELCHNGLNFAKATSIWYFIDINKRRPLKVPAHIIEKYNSLNLEPNFPLLHKKKFVFDGNIDFLDNISLRYSDFDSNLHVNNTAYFNYLQTALFNFKTKLPFIETIACQFIKEIPNTCKNVEVIISENSDSGKFKIKSETDFCIGEYKFRGL